MGAVPAILFYLLTLGSLFLPLRWCLVSFLLLANVDLGSQSASVGMLNASKSMLLPLYLMWRFRDYAGHGRVIAAPILWSTLILYVGVASAWSIYPPYAIKLVAHMLSMLMIVLMLMRATKSGYLDARTGLYVAAGTLIISLFHWRFVHDWGGETERFTSFAGAQAFAALLAALYCITLASKSLSAVARIGWSVALALSIAVNGSRMWLAGIMLSTLTFVLVARIKLAVKVVAAALTIISISLFLGSLDVLMKSFERYSRENRIADAVGAIYEGNTHGTALGTFNLRYELLSRTLTALSESNGLQILCGHGTSSGGALAAGLTRAVDPNRAIHNEWLRVLYEWGIAGFTLWIAFWGSIVLYTVRGLRLDKDEHALPLFIFLPAFFVSMGGENFIAGAGNVATMGFCMLLALASVAYRQRPSQSYWPARFRVPVRYRQPEQLGAGT